MEEVEAVVATGQEYLQDVAMPSKSQARETSVDACFNQEEGGTASQLKTNSHQRPMDGLSVYFEVDSVSFLIGSR